MKQTLNRKCHIVWMLWVIKIQLIFTLIQNNIL